MAVGWRRSMEVGAINEVQIQVSVYGNYQTIPKPIRFASPSVAKSPNSEISLRPESS